MLVELPRYIPLSEAAYRYDLEPSVLTSMIEDGRIDAVKTNGDIAVAEEDVSEARKTMAKREELWRRVQHLDGEPIGIEDAYTKYAMSPSSVYRWMERGYIRILRDRRGGGRGRKRLINEADIAYAAEVAGERGRKRGKPIFTSEFVPPHCSSN
jgi:hypothetical protein